MQIEQTFRAVYFYIRANRQNFQNSFESSIAFISLFRPLGVFSFAFFEILFSETDV